MNERISFLVNRKSVPTGRNKEFILNIYEMEKLLPMDGIFEKLKQNGLH